MKITLFLPVLILALTAVAQAEAPRPLNDLSRTLNAASKEQKLAFLLLGRSVCGNCNATKAMIRGGKIDVTAADYVMAYLDADDPQAATEFMTRFSKVYFGELLPYVVVTDARGKVLAASSGYHDEKKWNALLAAAKRKAGPKLAANGGAPGKSRPTVTKQ